MKKGFFLYAIIAGLLVLSACNTSDAPTDVVATLTFTPSETTIPPTPSDTPEPTATPPITGSVVSLQSINMRSGPGVGFSALSALKPATRVQILGRNTDGTWLNIRLEDGSEGWVSSDLIRIQPTGTPFPSITPSPNLTALAQGTSLPTALFGGGTITPTPPLSLSNGASPTPVLENANPATVAGLQLPNLEAINETATALAGGGLIPEVTNADNGQPLGGPTGGPIVTPSATLSPVPGSISTQQGVDVLAYCDNRSFGSPPPTNLAAGSTIDVFWSWLASTKAQVQDHIDAATYDVRLDGNPLDYRQYQGNIHEENGQWAVYWFVRSEPLQTGQHTISYKVSWSRSIFDGAKNYGPGTGDPQESGSCTFNVK
jgi:hypothetical protein